MLKENLKSLRLKHKLTQDNLATLLYVSRTTVTGWEKGKRIPDIFVLCKIADIYGVSLDYLMDREK